MTNDHLFLKCEGKGWAVVSLKSTDMVATIKGRQLLEPKHGVQEIVFGTPISKK